MSEEYRVRKCDCGNVMKIRTDSDPLRGTMTLECLDQTCYVKKTRVPRSRKRLAPPPRALRMRSRKFVHCGQCKRLRKLDMFEKMVEP